MTGNRERYNRLSSAYEAITSLGSFGGISRLYRAAAEALDVATGATLLELGCGPGTLTPRLREKVGMSGHVIGVDFAEQMIEQARRRAERSGWRNVRFECADALSYEPPSRVGGVVFSLSLSTMPGPARCLERALTFLEPGGCLVILDSFPDPSRPMASWVVRSKAPLVGARPTRAPLELAAAKLEDFRVRMLLGGVYSVVSGRIPT